MFLQQKDRSNLPKFQIVSRRCFLPENRVFFAVPNTDFLHNPTVLCMNLTPKC